MINYCCECGEECESQDFLCDGCHEWGITREEVFPTFTEQFHRIGKEGRRYWGRLGGGILFTDGKQILLLQRANDGDYAGYWGIPGGKAKKGELPLDTARRESKEECGENEGQRFGHFDSKDGLHHFHTYLYSIASPFEVKISKEHTHSKWVALEDVQGMQLHPKFKESWTAYLRAIEKNFPKRTTFQDWCTTKTTID